jgi:5-methylcytosine-specific restriction endonuclease McrA
VNVASVARALVLVWNDSAKVVDPEDYRLYTWADWSHLAPRAGDLFIQAVRQRLRVPEVIALAAYDRLPSAAVSFSRRNIFKRDHYTCQYCGAQPGSEELSIDHVVPRSRGGQSSWENCVLACIPCNTRKADRLPRQAGMKLRKQPERPAWKPMYARESVRIASWSRFMSEAYWNVTLEE